METRSFDRGAPGYLPAHVDLFMAKAARALSGRDGETLTRWDVLRQRFPLGPRGYATNEVDAFLVRLAAQFPDPEPAAQEEILRSSWSRPEPLTGSGPEVDHHHRLGGRAGRPAPALDGHGDLLVAGHRPVQEPGDPPSPGHVDQPGRPRPDRPTTQSW